MRNLILLMLIISAASCSVIKNIRRDKTKSEIHHYHDSTYFLEKQTIREIQTPGDSTKASFWLEQLLKSGYGKSTDRHFTTEVRYIDGNLEVTTSFDSILSRQTDTERTLSQVKNDVAALVDSKTKTKTIEVKNYTGLIIGLFLSLALFVLIIGAILYWRFHKFLKPSTS